MTSSRLSHMAMQHEAVHMASNYRQKDGWSSLDSSLKEDEELCSSPITADQKGRNPLSPMSRANSSPSLSTMAQEAQRFPQHVRDKLNLEGGLPFRSDGVSRSKSRSHSFYAHGDRNNTKINNNWRRSEAMHRQSMSYMQESSFEHRESCSMHPQVKLRSNRCPLCAAGEKMRRKSFIAPSTLNINSQRDNDFLGGGIHNHAPIEEVEEVSLDPKWAEALREISERLANKQAQQKPIEVNSSFSSVDRSFDGHEPFWDLEAKEDAPSANSGEDESYAPKPQQNNYQSTLHELHDTIEQATNSVGDMSDTDHEEEDDEMSESSFTRDAPIAKKFAESKGQPSLHGYQQARQCSDSLSAGLASLDKSNFEGPEITAIDSSNRSSGSESSVTLSVSSNFTMETYNSLRGPANITPRFALPKLNETQDPPENNSPTSVKSTNDLYPHTQPDENPPQEDNDLESSFFVSNPKDFCEKKTSPPAYSKVMNEDPAMSPEAPSPVVDRPQIPAKSEPVIERKQEVTAATARPAPQRRASSRSSMSLNPRALRNEQVLVEGAKECEGKENITGPAPRRPSMFDALVHNSRARSKSRGRNAARDRSRSCGRNVAARSKSRGRKVSCKSSGEMRRSFTVGVSSSIEAGATEGHGSEAHGREVVDDVTNESGEISKESTTTKTAAPTPRSRPSFFSALIHNSRSRSKSWARSKSRGRAVAGARSISRGRTVAEGEKQRESNAGAEGVKQEESYAMVGIRVPEESSTRNEQEKETNVNNHQKAPSPVPPELETATPHINHQKAPSPVPPELETATPSHPEDHVEPKKSSKKTKTPKKLKPLVTRGPITHPQYKLGDTANDGDMIVFPKAKSRRSRKGRRKNRRDSDDSSSDSDADHDEEDVEARKRQCDAYIFTSVRQLRHLDAAFVRRSDGKWTYALVADGDKNQIRFVVNDRGSTKSFPKALWKSCVRRIKVLTPKEGDRFATNRPKKKKITRSRSIRGKGRFVSPSPSRRNSKLIDLPPTIMEDTEYNAR